MNLDFCCFGYYHFGQGFLKADLKFFMEPQTTLFARGLCSSLSNEGDSTVRFLGGNSLQSLSEEIRNFPSFGLALLDFILCWNVTQDIHNLNS